MAEAIPSEVEVDNPQKEILDFTPGAMGVDQAQNVHLEADYVPTKPLPPSLSSHPSGVAHALCGSQLARLLSATLLP